MTFRSFLNFLGLSPAPLTMTFREVSPELAEKMGCTDGAKIVFTAQMAQE